MPIRQRLQPGQPILITYPAAGAGMEVFGEVILQTKDLDVVRLYREDGSTDAILLGQQGRGWRDTTNGIRVRVVEELSGPELSRFMLFRDYAHSGCATARQPSLKGLGVSA